MKNIKVVFLLLFIMLLLCSCGKTLDDAWQMQPESPAEEIATVEETVKYISIGKGNEYPADVEVLKLSNNQYEASALIEALGEFSSLKSLLLTNTLLSAEELSTISQTYPKLDFTYDFEAFGQTFSNTTDSLDFTKVSPSQIEDAADVLRKLPNVGSVSITSDEGTNLLSFEELGRLQAVAPGVAFDYKFTLFGQQISTADENVEYHDVHIGSDGIAEVEEALNYMTVCRRFVLDRCGIDNEKMGRLREEFPGIKLVWRIYFGKGHSCMTDTTRLRGKATQMLGGDKLDVLKYCTDVEFMDFGHARIIDNIDFINYMPKLKVVILSDTSIDSLEPLRNCKELQFIELCNCRKVTDISPLAELPNLKLVNISNCVNLHDVTCMFGKESLERLYLPINKVDAEQCAALVESLPNCWTTTERGPKAKGFSINYGVGWRLNSVDQNDVTEWYLELRQIFAYDRAFYNDDYFIRNEPPMPELVVFK